MKKHIWRPGDKCRIVTPKWVKRVGYPLVWYDLMEEVENDLKVGRAWDVLCGCEPRAASPVNPGAAPFLLDLGDSPTHGVPRYFLQAAAKALVEQRDFGGDERKIIYDEDYNGCQCEAGQVLEVYSKRVVKTGKRFAAAGGVHHSYDGPEDWYEPGGLADMQTHILLTTACGEIEAANVELVDKVKEV